MAKNGGFCLLQPAEIKRLIIQAEVMNQVLFFSFFFFFYLFPFLFLLLIPHSIVRHLAALVLRRGRVGKRLIGSVWIRGAEVSGGDMIAAAVGAARRVRAALQQCVCQGRGRRAFPPFGVIQ